MSGVLNFLPHAAPTVPAATMTLRAASLLREMRGLMRLSRKKIGPAAHVVAGGTRGAPCHPPRYASRTFGFARSAAAVSCKMMRPVSST